MLQAPRCRRSRDRRQGRAAKPPPPIAGDRRWGTPSAAKPRRSQAGTRRRDRHRETPNPASDRSAGPQVLSSLTLVCDRAGSGPTPGNFEPAVRPGRTRGPPAIAPVFHRNGPAGPSIAPASDPTVRPPKSPDRRPSRETKEDLNSKRNLKARSNPLPRKPSRMP